MSEQLAKPAETPNVDAPMTPVFEKDESGRQDLVGFQNQNDEGNPTGKVFTPEEVKAEQRK